MKPAVCLKWYKDPGDHNCILVSMGWLQFALPVLARISQLHPDVLLSFCFFTVLLLLQAGVSRSGGSFGVNSALLELDKEADDR